VNIQAVAATGDRVATLEAMRDKLAADMDVAPPTVTAQLAARLQAVLAELAEIAAPRKASSLDELDDRRKARLSAAGVAEAPVRASRQRR
jgi:hypothetical protein